MCRDLFRIPIAARNVVCLSLKFRKKNKATTYHGFFSSSVHWFEFEFDRRSAGVPFSFLSRSCDCRSFLRTEYVAECLFWLFSFSPNSTVEKLSRDKEDAKWNFDGRFLSERNSAMYIRVYFFFSRFFGFGKKKILIRFRSFLCSGKSFDSSRK